MDKFGHHIHKRLRLPDFLENFDKVLMRTETGEFDLQNTRLTGITIPLKNTDAVNKEYVDSQSQLFVKKQEVDIIFNDLKADVKKGIENLKADYYTKAELDQIIKSKK